MSEHVDFERLVAGHIADEGATPPSDAFYDELFTRAGGSGQRPEWLALIKEPPMRTNSRVAVGSPTVRVVAIMAATLLLAVALAMAGAGAQRLLASESPIVVAEDGSGHYATIQEAVDAADDGDEILIMPGTYAGPIDINKDIIVRGHDRGSVVIEFGAGCTLSDVEGSMAAETCPDESWLYDGFWYGDSPYGILLRETTTELSDLTVRGASTSEGAGIVIRGGAPDVSRVIFDGWDGNLYVHDGSAARIAESDLGASWIFVEERSPVMIEDSRFGAVVANTDNTGGVGGPSTIRNNTTYGIAFAGEALVEGNTVVLAGDEPVEDGFYGQGIDVQSGNGWVIHKNTVEGFDTGTGITVHAGGQGTISDNALDDNDVGIGLLYGNHVVVGNRITGGQRGISVLRGAAQLTDNVVEGASDFGIAIVGPASPVMTGNTSCGNGQNLYVDERATPEIGTTNEICEDVETD